MLNNRNRLVIVNYLMIRLINQDKFEINTLKYNVGFPSSFNVF